MDAYNWFWVFFVQNLLCLFWRKFEHRRNHFGHRLWTTRDNHTSVKPFISIPHQHPPFPETIIQSYQAYSETIESQQDQKKKKKHYLHNQSQAYLPGCMHFLINTGDNQKQGCLCRKPNRSTNAKQSQHVFKWQFCVMQHVCASRQPGGHPPHRGGLPCCHKD